MKMVAVVPARGGSKRIPRKNIKPFCGKPVIAWSIQAAQESRLFDSVIVSTEDAEIAAVAQSYGAEYPVCSSSTSGGRSLHHRPGLPACAARVAAAGANL
jgi:CMP-N-acetylneuraminic acid synthetase